MCSKGRGKNRFLSFRPPPERLFGDIVDTIDSNPMAVAAVERKLQIISEAAIRLGSEAERLCPDQPWRDIRGIGNQLRHAYERIDLETIWSAVTDDLPPLMAAVLFAVNRPRPKPRGPSFSV